MQLVFHTGAHFTEEERLMKCLLRNKAIFSTCGTVVPGPGKYRRLLHETMEAMAVSRPAQAARDILLDVILDNETAGRAILSNSNFFSQASAAVRNGLMYPKAAECMAQMADLFPQDEIELFMALKSPATFLPATFNRSGRGGLADVIGGDGPQSVRWSDTILKIREAAPKVAITVWCNEDAPLIWPEIIRDLGGLDPGAPIQDGYSLLSDIMAPDGMTRFRAYMDKHPDMTETHRRRVMVAFLEKYALDAAIDEELDMPGWTNALVDEMTGVYEDDVLEIAQIAGVRVLSP